MQVPQWPGDCGPSRPLGPMHSVTIFPPLASPWGGGGGVPFFMVSSSDLKYKFMRHVTFNPLIFGIAPGLISCIFIWNSMHLAGIFDLNRDVLFLCIKLPNNYDWILFQRSQWTLSLSFSLLPYFSFDKKRNTYWQKKMSSLNVS